MPDFTTRVVFHGDSGVNLTHAARTGGTGEGWPAAVRPTRGDTPTRIARLAGKPDASTPPREEGQRHVDIHPSSMPSRQNGSLIPNTELGQWAEPGTKTWPLSILVAKQTTPCLPFSTALSADR